MSRISLAATAPWLLFLAAPALRAQTPLTTTLVANGFAQPVYVTAPPGDQDRLFVVQQAGQIRIVKNGVILPTPFIDLSGPVLSGSERGLLGLAFHPNYASNGFFYVNYTRDTDGATVVARYQVSAGNPDVANAASATILLVQSQPFSNHNAGCIQFGPDGFLYVAMGDGGSGNDPQGNGQNVNTLLGAMLRIDVDNPAPMLPYGLPPNNPFAGAVPGRDEIWAIGLRNPWRFSFDRLTGDMYIGDVGQNAREEIDFQSGADFFAAPGSPVQNYGWRCMEGTLCTGLSGCACNGATLTPPIHTYVNQPCYAVTGGYVYRGCAIPDLRGTYFFADYCSNQIWSFRYIPGTGTTQFTNRTAQLDPPGAISIASISSFGEDACGEILIVDRNGGEIFKIVPQTPQTTGLMAYGTGTPGCSGPHAMGASGPPVVFDPCFEINASNAPPNAAGVLAVADLPDLAGSDPFGIGLTVHLNLASNFLLLLPIASDANGIGTTPIPIPNLSALVGATFHTQSLWFWAPSVCTPTILGASSSQGLSVTIQP